MDISEETDQMDPAACRVIYIDDRFNTERWISREGSTPIVPQPTGSQTDFNELPIDLQANVNAFLSVFNQVYVCNSGRAFSTKLGELNDKAKPDCTPIIACFDVGSEIRHNHFGRSKSRFAPGAESPLSSPSVLRREITFSSESDESYGLQLLSRIASDLQVEEGVQLIIPVAIVQPKRRDSYDHAILQAEVPSVLRAPYGQEKSATKLETDQSDIIDPQMMLQCLDAGAVDVVRSPLDKAGIMGLTVHAYRIYKKAKSEQKGFMALRKRRKQSWVGVEDEKPYAYLREAMVKKLLKGICDPQEVIEDYQHRDLIVAEGRKAMIATAIGQWSFCGHDFTEDELVFAGYLILNHALSIPQLEQWKMSRPEILRFMQGCQIAYNSFVLYHNFRHAVDVLQSLFYFLLQIGALPPYPANSEPPPLSNDKSPIAKLVGPFEALTLLISAIGHDVGHPGVNNMFLVKLNAPLAQLYNDQSVLEAFHCAAYSQILRRHWPVVFHDKSLRKLMIGSILATDMGVHSDYMSQLGQLQEKIHESKVTDGWSPKDIEQYRNLACGLLIKCADISNVSRPWAVAEKWTYLLQEEFANQGEMEAAVGMETTLFGGPPEIGNMLKLANGQIGFMTIFAHPLFSNVADIIPAMGFAAKEILTNKGVWFTRAEQEKKRQLLKRETNFRDGNAISPRSRSPVGPRKRDSDVLHSPLRGRHDAAMAGKAATDGEAGDSKSDRNGSITPKARSLNQSLSEVAAIASPIRGLSPKRSPSNTGTEKLPVNPTEALVGSTDQVNIAQNLPNSQAPSTPGPQLSEAESRAVANAEDETANMSELSDERRDNAVSMRAGSASIPIVNGNDVSTAHQSGPRTEKELSKFTWSSTESQEPARPGLDQAQFSFATSNHNEPVRTVDTNHLGTPGNADSRASAPFATLEHDKHREEMSPTSRPAESATSESTTASRPDTDDVTQSNITPIQSISATSYTTEASEKGNLAHRSPMPQSLSSDHSTSEDRAISAPLSSPLLQQTCSMSSDQSSNREGSKLDIHTTVYANGDGISEDNNERNRKISTRTIGRRRSRMKLKDLAFWKKSKPEKNVHEAAEA